MATAQIRWLSVAEGGRKTPIGGHIAATGYVQGEGPEELFSVYLETRSPRGVNLDKASEVTIETLAEEMKAKLIPGETIVVTEGVKPIARCLIVSRE